MVKGLPFSPCGSYALAKQVALGGRRPDEGLFRRLSDPSTVSRHGAIHLLPQGEKESKNGKH